MCVRSYRCAPFWLAVLLLSSLFRLGSCGCCCCCGVGGEDAAAANDRLMMTGRAPIPIRTDRSLLRLSPVAAWLAACFVGARSACCSWGSASWDARRRRGALCACLRSTESGAHSVGLDASGGSKSDLSLAGKPNLPAFCSTLSRSSRWAE